MCFNDCSYSLIVQSKVCGVSCLNVLKNHTKNSSLYQRVKLENTSFFYYNRKTVTLAAACVKTETRKYMSRTLPNNIEAEQALLGSMLVYPNSIRIVIESGLEAKDFYVDAHRTIYQSFTKLNEQGKAIDATMITGYLMDTGQINQIGGAEYILRLADTATTSANMKHYVELIQSKATLRNLIESAHQIIENTYESQAEMDDLMEAAERSILNVTRSRKVSEFRNAPEVIKEVLFRIEQMSKNKSRITGMKTGYQDLDNTTNGFQKGDLIILAARPSMGKTALALNLGMGIAKHTGLPAAIFSLEMPAEQLMMRMLSAESRIEGSKIRTGYLSEHETNNLNEAAFRLRQSQIFIDDSPTLRVAEIFSKCRKLQAENDLGVIIVDYIQLISSFDKAESRQQQVSEISRNLKALARELNVPVIALSQLSRAAEQRGENKRPMLSDLRESGAIEQDADLVLFLYREKYYERFKGEDKALEPGQEQQEHDGGSEEVELNIAKHRNGATRVVKLAFQRDINKFYDSI